MLDAQHGYGIPCVGGHQQFLGCGGARMGLMLISGAAGGQWDSSTQIHLHKGHSTNPIAKPALSLLWARLFVLLEEDHQEVLRHLPTPQLPTGPGHLHLLLLPKLPVQPECMPGAPAGSAMRCQGVPFRVLLHLLSGAGRKWILKD